MGFEEILLKDFIKIGDYNLNLFMLLSATIILVGSKVLIDAIDKLFFKKIFVKRGIDIGRQFAVRAFFKYVIYTIAILWALHVIGIQLSLLWGGAAALLVGIGLGLQQTFNDLISGIILLLEGTVEVGDIVSVDGLIGKVIKIGIRTSKVETRNDITIIIPNSKLVVDNVINWSHNNNPDRFQISIGVAYSSDVQLVSSLLIQAAQNHDKVLKHPTPKVMFKDFGSSSLDFDLHFYSMEFFRIELVKSDIRFKIIELFRQHDIEIPFPQNDVWVRSSY